MSDSVVSTIEPLCVNPVEKLHPVTQATARCLNKEVVVVRHQAVRVTDPALSIDNVSKDFEESGPIALVEKDTFSPIATTSDVVYSACVFQPQRSCHTVRSLSQIHPNNKGVTPLME